MTHVAKGEKHPAFLILHVADHPDTSTQAFCLGAVLKEAEVNTTVFGAKETNHVRLNDNLGITGRSGDEVAARSSRTEWA